MAFTDDKNKFLLDKNKSYRKSIIVKYSYITT